MYSSSRGGNAGYGGQQQQQQQQKQPYSSQSAYSQNLGHPYSVGGPDGSSQLSVASRHSSMLSGPKESEHPGYRGHVSTGGSYGGQYSSVYGSASGQVPGKGASPALEGRIGYGSALPDSPRFTSGDYVSSSSHGYGQKSDPLFADKNTDYPSIERRQYGERPSAFAGRDLHTGPASLYGDSISYGRQHQADIYDRMDQASMLRQEILKSQSLQSASLDGVSRQAEYLSTRGPSAHHAAQDLIGYGGRADADPRSASYGAQHPPSILGAAPPQRSTEDLLYSSNPGYGVSLPPGRDYASGKGLHGASLDSDYLADRVGYARELDRREEDRRRELLREREKERERDKARDRERDRERERDRSRERERARESDRVREKLRERERERERKERDRERARGSETRRERSLSRVSKDRAERGGSSLAKDVKPTKKESPRRETSRRRPSPVREKRREYVCKVHSSSLVEFERDYLSLDKRYARLYVSPHCSKVVVRWPRENLRLSLHTPVSFEHNFVGEDAGVEHKEHAAIPINSGRPMVVWNAKMILMSGLSQNALEELSSDRSYDDRIPHYCNMLRFAILKRDNAFMAIGGPWDAVDGGDPSVDDSSLVQTVTRYAKDVAQLDLKNCRNWNRFLEIHYERIGKDGLFSHKEVTVLFVPDLSECLPTFEAWRDQWFAHKKAIAVRESQLAQKKDKSKEKKGGTKDKETESHKKEKDDIKKEDVNTEKQSGPVSGEQSAVDKNITEKKDDDQKSKEVVVRETAKPNKTEVEDVQNNKEAGGTASGGKTVKKKIIKKVIKKQVGAEKKQVLENPATISNNVEISTQQDEPSAASGDGVKTFARKKVVKKVTAANKTESPNTPQKELVAEAEGSKTDTDATVKKVTKKKIIKRVLKKKTTAGTDEATNGVGGDVTIAKLEENKTSSKAVIPEKSSGNSDKEEKEKGGSEKTVEEKPKGKDKSKDEARKDQKGKEASKDEAKKDQKGKDESKDEARKDQKGKGASKDEAKKDQKAKDESKDEARKGQKGKDESKSKVKTEVKEKKPEEPPRHPGLFLQTKAEKDSKLRSLSLSLDSLLDYTDKDTDESTFEISLFAESLQEMLQYQMGCRLLTFLQKLRMKFVIKRNQRKRQREENAKENEKKSSTKRLKPDEAKVEEVSVKMETDVAAQADDGKDKVKEDAGNSADGIENVKQGDETTDVDDPEEDPEEEDEEMPDESSQHDSVNDEKDSGEKIESYIKVKKEIDNSEDKKQGTTEEIAGSKPVTGSESKEKEDKMEKKKKETAVIDKQLLEAFRFFDRNRVGYIKVEDMRLIVHNLGKFLSHRDVKELVQSALLESSTGRDDRILYPKLVKMADI